MAQESKLRAIFCKRLYQRRTELGISQRTLGMQIGLTKPVAHVRINRYELGVHEPDMKTIQRLAEQLGVPVAYLFAEDDRLARIILAFDGLSVTEQERLLKSVEPKKSARKKTTDKT